MQHAPASTDFLAPFANLSFWAFSSEFFICYEERTAHFPLTVFQNVIFYPDGAGICTCLQKLVGCKHSHSNGIERHQSEHVAFVAIGFVLVTLQLLLHAFLHLMDALRGLKRARGVHIDGLASRSTQTWTYKRQEEFISQI